MNETVQILSRGRGCERILSASLRATEISKDLFTFALAISLVGTLASTVYCCLSFRAAAYFKRQRPDQRPTAFEEPLSVLKPVHGLDAELELNLETFFEQDYPEFELIFCARTLRDDALEVVRRVSGRYPNVPVKIIAGGEPLWPNPRTFSVNTMMGHAEHHALVVTDSDVRVERDFLTKIAAPLADPANGLVTCLYRGVSEGGFWSKLEALGMSVELMSNVLIANMLEGMKFALGPATATRREYIARIGGLESTSRYYADDFALGSSIAGSGLTVVLSSTVVEHIVPRSSFRNALTHQILWMKNNRFLRPKGHWGVGLTFAMPYALLGFLATWRSGALGWALLWLAWGISNCMARSIAVGWAIVRDREALDRCWLYPIRDLLGFVVWLLSFAGNRVLFRGEQYRLLAGGEIRRISN
jgi:ceramide glucosyltransferase